MKTEKNKTSRTLLLLVLLLIATVPITSFSQEDAAVEAKISTRESQLKKEMDSRLATVKQGDPAYKTKLELAQKLNGEARAKVDAQNVADRLAAKRANPNLYPNIKSNSDRINQQGVQYGQLPADADRNDKVQYGKLGNDQDKKGWVRAADGKLLPPPPPNTNGAGGSNSANAGQNGKLLPTQQNRYEPISAKKEVVPPAQTNANSPNDQNKIQFSEKQSRVIAEGRQDLKDIEKNRQGQFQQISGANKGLLKKQANERELLANKQYNQKQELIQNQETKKNQLLRKVDDSRSKMIATSKDGKLTTKQEGALKVKRTAIENKINKETNKKLAAQAKVNERPKQELQKRQLAEAKKSIKSNKSQGSSINKSAKKEAKPIKKKITKTISKAKKATAKAVKKASPKKVKKKK